MYEIKLFHLYQSRFDDDDPVMINTEGLLIILSFSLINPQLHLEDNSYMFYIFLYGCCRVNFGKISTHCEIHYFYANSDFFLSTFATELKYFK